MAHHILKQFVKHYEKIVYCEKHAIIRENDRNYQVNDTITLQEGQDGLNGYEYTGNQISARITDIDDFGCQHGYVCLSLSDVGLLVVDNTSENKS